MEFSADKPAPVVNILKYGKDGPFCEPIVRCDSCARLVFLVDLKKHGACIHCGNIRVRNTRTLTVEEKDQVVKWIAEGRCDQEWLDEFEAIES